jgi:hypothetical protein
MGQVRREVHRSTRISFSTIVIELHYAVLRANIAVAGRRLALFMLWTAAYDGDGPGDSVLEGGW